MGTKENEDLPEDTFLERKSESTFASAESEIHVYGLKLNKCDTGSRGYATPKKNQSSTELVLGASEGFIPLWKEGVNLRWRFNPSIYDYFENPNKAINGIRSLLADGLTEWGWNPVKFTETNDAWDFEIVVRKDNCSPRGCTLASAFFPDGGRHQLVIYPSLFKQSKQEQIETMAHEFGHIFGLRHFFAQVEEKAWPSVIFGEHKPFTIMNYGEDSKMTKRDRTDLKRLYEKVWSGELTKINGTRIVTFYPYHVLGGIR